MEDAANLRGYLSFKAAGKFCLLYFIFLLTLTLIFSALSCEPMTSSQRAWWWGFIVSLVLTISVFIVALAILLYTDNYAPPNNTSVNKLAEQYEMSQSNAANDPSRTQSYKTVLTINSMSIPEPAPVVDTTQKNVSETFMNLTPQPSRVTVMDMPAINAKRKENIGKALDTVDVVPAGAAEKDKKKKKQKEKAKKRQV